MVASSQPPDKYTVDRLPAVTVEIRRLVARAKELGMGPQVIDALQSIVSKLEMIPLEWAIRNMPPSMAAA